MSEIKEPRLYSVCGYYHRQYDGDNTWWDRQNIIQDKDLEEDGCDVSILGYDIHLDKIGRIGDRYNCFYRAEIKKDGSIIHKDDSWVQCTGGGGSGEVSDLRWAFGQTSTWAYYECKRVNSYFWIRVPKDQIGISIDANPSVSVMDDEKADIYITNNWEHNLNAKIEAKVCTPTLIGEYCDTYELSEENLAAYSTIQASIDIPTTTAGEMTIIPVVHFRMTPQEAGIVGMNYGDQEESSVPITSVDYIELGYIQGDGFSVEVTGEPVYIVQDCNELGCPSDYTCIGDEGYCIKTEYEYQTCEDIGCPEGYNCVDQVCVNPQNNRLIYVLVGVIVVLIGVIMWYFKK